ncbi:tetratricopeptide repeat protein [Limnoraphis robusta]|uniref:Tetratricopeptide repeat protein n=1 Tax=Limnoraphis robusta CCNP1315 TaxID=3110306 RepID=A0ABU5U2V8_9CYAN|nr:tetratricopeptide repeat protein [Limnoraphis robusta]MEA5521449.1 tetratricopeptide repeat protein [Limnoraphis robusta CCNP1315]MEA5546468.1 tetratricopeptide repeat protein [Limnoraphis robusta CCNP1324]
MEPIVSLESSVQQLDKQAEDYLSQKKYSEAIAVCQQALKIQPNLKSYKTLGLAFQSQGQLETSLQCYVKALEIQPDDTEVYHNIASIYAQKKQWKDAMISYQVALRLDPKDEKNYLNLGNVLAKLGQLEEAIACYHQLINLNPNLAIVYQKLGDALFQLKRWDDAIFAFRRVLELNQNCLWSYLHLGKIYIQKQQWDNAIAACHQAIKINPKAAWSYNNLGDAFSEKKQWHDAVIAYLYAIKIRENPFNASFLNTIYERLGYAIRQQINQSSFEKVIDGYYQVFQMNYEKLSINYSINIAELGFTPNHAEPYLQLGEALVQCQQFEAAIIFHKLADKIQPNYPEVFIKIQQVLHQQQKFQQVITECYQSIQKNPNSPDAYTTLGNLLTQKGQAKEAILYHQKALVLKGWDLCQQRNYQFTQDWFSNNIRTWQEHLKFLSNSPELKILEIGSYQGMSTCWFLDYILTHPTAKITCIDPYFKPEFEQNINQTGFPEKVIKMIGYSQDILSSLQPNFYDIVYIDGCHQAVPALQDTLQSWRLTKIGGIIIFDDYEVNESDNPDQQAKVGIDCFLNWVSDAITVIHKGYQLMIRKTATGLKDEEIDTYSEVISISATESG